jgi:hypothetical protein
MLSEKDLKSMAEMAITAIHTESKGENEPIDIRGEGVQKALKIAAYAMVMTCKDKDEILVKMAKACVVSAVSRGEIPMTREAVMALSQSVVMSCMEYEHVLDILKEQAEKDKGEAKA